MRKTLINTIKRIDQILMPGFIGLFGDRPSLITILFHGLFNNRREIGMNIADPQQGITLEYFRRIIGYFSDNGYIFVSPDDIPDGLDMSKRYILITFDDGYFNNLNVMPVLKEFEIPAIFFISTNHVENGKAFWWDIIYRERVKKGISLERIAEEQEQLKSRTHDEIEAYIVANFSSNSLKPVSDIDRPFTPDELRAFSEEKYVFLGNHTSDHGILANYTEGGARSQILGAQKTLFEMTGLLPSAISYPCGSYTGEVIKIAKEIGLRSGVTVESRKNYFPIGPAGDDIMKLGRFTLWGGSDLIDQCRFYHSEFSLYKKYRTIRKRLK